MPKHVDGVKSLSYAFLYRIGGEDTASRFVFLIQEDVELLKSGNVIDLDMAELVWLVVANTKVGLVID